MAALLLVGSLVASQGVAGAAHAADLTPTSYASTVLADSPAAFYQFNETGGSTAADSSGNGIDGTYDPGVTLGVPGPIASDPASSAVTPSGPAVDVPNTDLPSGDFAAVTYEFWAKGTTDPATGATLFSIPGATAIQIADNDGTTAITFPSYGGAFTYDLPATMPLNTWFLVDVTSGDGDITVYVDGQEVGALGGWIQPYANGSLQLGGWSGASFADLAVYPSVLSSIRIQAHWTAGGSSTVGCTPTPTDPYSKTVLADAPSLYAPMGDLDTTGTGQVAYDDSGNCANAAYTGQASSDPGDGPPGEPSGAVTDSGGGPVLAESNTDLPSGDFAAVTYEFWAKGTTDPATGATLFSIPGATAIQIADNDGTTAITFPSYGGAFTYDLPATMPLNTWFLVDVTSGDGDITVYVDGQEVGALGGWIQPYANGSLQLGGWSGASFADLAVYPSVLSSIRIQAHWTAGGSSTVGCTPTPTDPYSKTVLADAPSLYAPMGDLDTTGTGQVAYDDSGNCANAAYTGQASSDPGDGPPGEPSGAVTDSGGGPVLAESNTDLPSGDFAAVTYEFWAKGTTDPATGATLFSIPGATAIQIADNDGTTAITFPSYGGAFTYDLPATMPLNTWFLVDVTSGDGDITVYVDGQEVGALGGWIQPYANGSLQLGGWSGASFADLAVYPSVLSSIRIQAHWTAGGSSTVGCTPTPTDPYSKTVLADAPSLYAPMGDLDTTGTGQVAYDDSGNCANAAYTGQASSDPGDGPPGEPSGAVTDSGGGPVLAESNTDLPSGDFAAVTYEFWAKGTTDPATGATLFSIPGATAIQIADNDGTTAITFPSYGGAFTYDLPATMPLNTWFLVDVTSGDGDITVYVDGQEVGALGGWIQPYANGSLQLGGWSGASFADLAVYPSVLTPDEIAADWTAGETAAPHISLGLTALPSSGAAPFQTNFTLSASDWTGKPVAYQLSFGDGQETSGTVDSPYEAVTISHTYGNPGMYKAGVSATDGSGQVSTAAATVTVTGTPPLQPNAGEPQEAEVGTSVTLDGSGSQPAASISSYTWSFGDATANVTGSTPIVQHTYTKPGTYVASLTIAGGGHTATANTEVTVVAAPAPDQGMAVTVTDDSGAPLSGATVALVDAQGVRYSATTGSNGVGVLDGAPDGSYTAYAYDPGYLPGSVTVTQSDGTGSATVALRSGAISQTSASATPLDYQQILAAGIDPNDPANLNVYEFSVHLAFTATETVDVGGYITGCGLTQSSVTGATLTSASGSCGSVTFTTPGGDEVIGSVLPPGSGSGSDPEPSLVWMIIPGEAQWLKEFFDVTMVVSNLAPTGYSFEHGSITLGDLPAGLSLAPTATPQTLSQSVSDVPAGGSTSASWVLRGDDQGYYGLTGTYSGELDAVGPPDVQIAGLSFPIATAAGAIHVWGGSALQMTVDTDDQANLGDPYLVRVGLTNVADVPVYDVGITLNEQGRLNYIYQPGQQLTQSTPVIQPGDTFWTTYYRLVPEISGTLDLADSFVQQTPDAGNVEVASSIVSHPATPADQVPTATATSQAGGVEVDWADPVDPGITGYEISYTPTRNTAFGDPSAIQPATLPVSATSAFVPGGQAGCYEVSALDATGTATIYDSLACTAPSAATAGVSPGTVRGSGKTTVTGSGFSRGKVDLYLDDVSASSELGTASASASGTFSKSVKIDGVEAGSHTIIALGPDGASATAPMTIATTLTVKPSTPKPGGTVKATVEAFQPGELVTFTLGSQSGPVIGSGVAGSSGTTSGVFTGDLSIPSGTAAGETTIVAHGLFGSNASAALTIK